MEKLVFLNNASSEVGSALSNGGTSITISAGTGARFPLPGVGEAFLVTLFEKDTNGLDTRLEIAKCTGRVADTLTLERDVEGIVATAGGPSSGGYAYPSATGKTVYIEMRETALMLGQFLQSDANLSDLDNAATARTNLGLGTAAVEDATAFATAAHNHSGTYEPADATILKDADIGVTVQAYDSDLTSWAGIAPSAKQDALVSGTSIKTVNSVGLLDSGDVAVQATLVSGTNIKTINGASVLGSGDIATYGQQTIWIPAAAMKARTTNGAASGTVETTTNKVMVQTLDFDAAADEFAQFTVRMPKSWNRGTVTAYFLWSSNVSGTNAVVWGVQGVALSDDDALDAAFNTAQTVTDAQTAQGDLMQTAETSAITIGGTPATGDLVVLQIYRDADNGGDTLAGDARLHGMALIYTQEAATDA